MDNIQKRALLYGGAILSLGGIVVAWCNAETEADVMTLLSSADVQLRMAYSIPAADRDGRPLESREDLIASAERHLATVEAAQPGMAVTAEFRGFAHMLRRDYTAAADCYRRARQCRDVQDEQRDVLAFNEARMLAKAGSRQQALSVFAANAAALDERYGPQRLLEEAAILRELGRRADAERQLDRVVRTADVSPLARLQAGREYLALGHVDKAEQALTAARGDFPIADYHLALLKLRRGEADSCYESLGRAIEARPAEVRQMLRDEAEAWSAIAEDMRFQQLTMPTAATPGR